jgi:hypothetical protein
MKMSKRETFTIIESTHSTKEFFSVSDLRCEAILSRVTPVPADTPLLAR